MKNLRARHLALALALTACGSDEPGQDTGGGAGGQGSTPPIPVCDDDGTCEIGETCDACPSDCGSCEIPAPCERLNAAAAGETVVISGEMGDDRDGQGAGCDVRAEVAGVRVVGSWRGDLRCRHCDEWIFEDLEVAEGSLRFIAGDGWTLRNSTVDGGGRGIMAVVGTGSDDTADGQSRHWLIDHITSRNPGCRPPDDPYPTHARALYIIGKNGIPNDGVIQNSTFEGEGCAVTVKIGGTGNFGSWSGAADAADAVTFRDNTIRTVGDGLQPQALLLATNSDDVTVTGNTLIANELAISASGPWSGTNLLVEGNTISAPTFLQARLWNNPAAGAAAPLYGEKYVTYEDPGPCPEVGNCIDNHR